MIKKKEKRKRIYTLTKVDKIYAHLSANRYHRSNLRFSALLTPRVPCRVALSFIKFKGRSSIFINSKKKERKEGKKTGEIPSNLPSIYHHKYRSILLTCNFYVKLPKFPHRKKKKKKEKNWSKTGKFDGKKKKKGKKKKRKKI